MAMTYKAGVAQAKRDMEMGFYDHSFYMGYWNGKPFAEGYRDTINDLPDDEIPE